MRSQSWRSPHDDIEIALDTSWTSAPAPFLVDGVAIANFFPQIGLSAFLGQASTPLSQITAGSANVWSIAANLGGPIYTGGALTAQKRQAIAAWEQAKLQYRGDRTERIHGCCERAHS